MTIVASSTPRALRSVSLVEALFLLLAPLVSLWLFGISLINQNGYVDPEFYTGYGQSFDRMMHVFPLTYYAARFPIMFLNLASQSLLPGFAGYVAVRAVVFATSALPLYFFAKRVYGRQPALVGYAFLFLNPLFPRVLCWDLTTFLSIPMGLAGISLWLMATRPISWSAFAAGFAFGVAINSHVFTGTAIVVFLGVDFAFAIRYRGLSAFALRCAAALTGTLTCFSLGLLFYTATVGFISPRQLWRVTFGAIVAGQNYANTHFVPLADYYAVNYEMYSPIVATAAALALNRRVLFRNTIDARLTWFAAMYLAAYGIAVFVLQMNIVQYFWYFGHLTIAVFLVVPVLVARLRERWDRAPLWFATTLAAVAILVAFRFAMAARVMTLAAGNGTVPVAILAAAAVAIVLLCTRHRLATIAGGVGLALVLQTVYLSGSHLSVYDRTSNALEIPLFDAIRSYHALLNRYDRVGQRVRTWFPSPNPALLSLSSSNLLFTLQDPWMGQGPPAIGQTEMANLNDQATAYVVLISPTTDKIESGLRALSAAGIRYSRLELQHWGRPPLELTATLVKVER